MDKLVHSGGTWEQIRIGREIDAHQVFLQKNMWRAPLRWECMMGIVGGQYLYEKFKWWPFFLENSALKVRKSIKLPLQIY